MAPPLLPALLAAAAVRPAASFCPKGFGGGASFPVEWRIPEWPDPQSLPRLYYERLKTVTLGGFKLSELNEEYLEGPTGEFLINGRPTYWQASGDYFMYYCQRFMKWRIAGISAFGENKNGQCYAFVSDLERGRDILDPSLIKGWIEVEEGEWVEKKEAGVVRIGTLGEQLESVEGSQQEGEETEECATEEAEQEEGSSDPQARELFGEKKGPKKTKCPVKWAAGKVQEGVVAVSKWVRRLFPALLGAPPEDEEDGAAGGGGAGAQAPAKAAGGGEL